MAPWNSVTCLTLRELCSFVDLCGNRKELHIRARISHWNAGQRCSFFHISESLQFILEFFICCALHAILILTSRFPFWFPIKWNFFNFFKFSVNFILFRLDSSRTGKSDLFFLKIIIAYEIAWILIKSFGLQIPSINCVVFASEHTRSILHVSKQNRQPLIGLFYCAPESSCSLLNSCGQLCCKRVRRASKITLAVPLPW